MKEKQKEIDAYFKEKNWPYWKPAEIMLRLSEEVGELAREINHEFGPKKKKESEEKNSISDELGDIIYTITCLANSLDIDLDKSFKSSMAKSYGRDKNRF